MFISSRDSGPPSPPDKHFPYVAGEQGPAAKVLTLWVTRSQQRAPSACTIKGSGTFFGDSIEGFFAR
jgi:hypothetical protein